ncbi:MAG: acetate--CoA ligase family protein, partial [Deltaproteobacteria bacterium]|nr:acetate--CoA ligase family protein [Deltaproteobacteria bacterium]
MNPKNATNSTNPLPIDELLKNAIEDGSKSLNEYDAKRLLGAYGIPVPAETVAHTPQEAVGAAVQMGYPVVVKGLGSQ